MCKSAFLLAWLSCMCMGFNQRSSTSTRLYSQASAVNVESLGLTPKLETYATGLKGVPDDKLRYQQLLFLAAKCKPMPAELKIDANKVPGCLSTVHVHATIDKETAKITYTGDSDAQLTKGLVAMLVNGLSGHTYVEIERVKPEFINFAGIANSLTPGRNNGFLNMLRMMKVKAKALSEEVGKAKQAPTSSSSSSTSASSSNNNIGVGGGGPIADAVLAKLSMLQPSELVLDNESHKHAGHAGMNGQSRRESHFNLRIVASCFEGLSLVQRHKMIYSLLADQMQTGPGEHIHALSISARTPSEQG